MIEYIKVNRIIFIVAGLILLAVLIIGQQTGVFSKIVSYLANIGTGSKDIILFYGDGCTHCISLEEYMKTNKIEEKIKLTKLEVFNNQNNQDLLLEKRQKCGLDASVIEVPSLWDGKNCLVGDTDIIKFFEDAVK